MSRASRAVLVYLERCADAGEPCGGARLIGERLSYAADTIYKALRDLRKLELIECLGTKQYRVIRLTESGKQTGEYFTPRPITIRPKVHDLVQSASELFEVSAEEILGPSRLKKCTAPRFAVVHVAMKRGWHQSHVARALGRDHTSIRNARLQAEELIRRDEDFDMRCASLARRHPLKEMTMTAHAKGAEYA